MGQRITQRIRTCAICDKTPDDGEHMWEMPSGAWCEECCDRSENEISADNSDTNKKEH